MQPPTIFTDIDFFEWEKDAQPGAVFNQLFNRANALITGDRPDEELMEYIFKIFDRVGRNGPRTIFQLALLYPNGDEIRYEAS